MATKLSEFEKAVYGHRKIMQYQNSDVKRWLDDDSIIELTLKQQTYKNAEFYVNENPNHTIWYSQLKEIFLRLDNLELVAGEIIKKDNSKCFIYEMSVPDFVEYVSGKKFKVEVNPDGKVAKFNDEKSSGMSLEELADTIKYLYTKGEYQVAAGYLIGSTEYNLREV